MSHLLRYGVSDMENFSYLIRKMLFKEKNTSLKTNTSPIHSKKRNWKPMNKFFFLHSTLNNNFLKQQWLIKGRRGGGNVKGNPKITCDENG